MEEEGEKEGGKERECDESTAKKRTSVGGNERMQEREKR